MSSILSSAARTTLYPHCNGSGRDTYISFNNGGNTTMYSPKAGGVTMGQMTRIQGNSGVQGNLPPKSKFYEQNGTGRDTYIMCSSGGFYNQFSQVSASDCHVKNLRNYTNSITQYQHDLNRLSKR